MRNRFFPAVLIAAISAVAVAPAQAALTSQQIRDQLISIYRSMGYTVAIGNEVDNAGTITLDSLTMSREIPQSGATISISYDKITLSPSGDAVAMTISPNINFSVDIPADRPGRKDVSVAAHMVTTDFRAMFSGDVRNIKAEVSLAKAIFTLDDVLSAGQKMPATASLVAHDSSGSYRLGLPDGGGRTIDGDATLGSVVFSIGIDEPGGKGYVKASGSLAGLEQSFSVSTPDLSKYDMNDPTAVIAMIKDGLSVSGSLALGKMAVQVDSLTRNKTSNVAVTSDSGNFGISLSRDRVSYGIAENGVRIRIASQQLPIPEIKVGYDQLALNFDLPLAQASAPSDFSVSIALRNLAVDDAVWSMFDPGGMLVHDPATLAVALSGKLLVLTDLLDPEKVAQMSGPPWIPTAINLNELTASALGAILTGKGSFKVDMSSGKTINGLPLPVGAVDLDLKGAYGLIDSLASMGLLKDKQTMGFKGMLGAFAKPVGEDHVTSRIEVTQEGEITANGQRLK